uniref:Transmembrane protein n=1 Tax=Rousettus aegyptiacus TaxID=9407 RepID=A0A7J8IMY7_ROUAE|nr:hypothetical protein HJG63_010685 [Rousettus aegyptiacus]
METTGDGGVERAVCKGRWRCLLQQLTPFQFQRDVCIPSPVVALPLLLLSVGAQNLPFLRPFRPRGGNQSNIVSIIVFTSPLEIVPLLKSQLAWFCMSHLFLAGSDATVLCFSLSFYSFLFSSVPFLFSSFLPCLPFFLSLSLLSDFHFLFFSL